MAAATAATASAVPARRGYVAVPAADGTTVMVQKTGDEFGHWFADADGRMMIKRDGVWVYASADEAAARRAARKARFDSRNAAGLRRAASRAVGNYGTFPGATFPLTGKQKAIVILVEYQDEKFHLGDHAYDYFNNMLNQKGFSEYNATGCVNEYFLDSSNGAFDCQYDVYGPVTLKYNMAHYGGNDASGQDKAPWEMVLEACAQLDPTVDFSQYDRDGDGVIDNVYVIYAGRGEASDIFEEYPNTVWPHSWDVSQYKKKFDGKLLATYGCSNEWEDIVIVNKRNEYEIVGERPDGIGTFVHEFSHILGLPDLYDTSDRATPNYYTPGTWSVLDYGPYNNEGRTPPAYSAFERNALGWIDLTDLTAGNHTLGAINETNAAMCIANPAVAEEFYLIEHRRQTGWDTYLPGEGMVIWHVDYDYDAWTANTVNNNTRHQYVDMIEADRIGSKKVRDAGDCFPGSANVTSCSLNWWADGKVDLALSDIAMAADAATVSFTAAENTSGGGDEPVGGDCLTVADVLSYDLDGPKDTRTVQGYIVGYVPSGSFTKSVFGDVSKAVNSNIVLADNPDDDDPDVCIPVQLPKGSDARTGLNLKDNPEALGRRVEITGTVETYCLVPGVKNVSSYRFIDGTDAIDVIETVEPQTPAGAVFDLQGRRVAASSRAGIYIVNGRKILVR